MTSTPASRRAPRSGPKVSYLVGRLDRAISREITRRIRPHGLSLAEYTALSILSVNSGLSNAELARRSLVRPQSMMQVVGALEAHGMIRREPDRDHGRILRTELTGKGRRALQACDETVSGMERQMLSGLGRHQRKEMVEVLQRCFTNLSEQR